jgi:hypothetical protein
VPEILPGRGNKPDRQKKGTGGNRENGEEITNLRYLRFEISEGRRARLLKAPRAFQRDE